MLAILIKCLSLSHQSPNKQAGNHRRYRGCCWLVPEMHKGVALYWLPKQEANNFFFLMQAEICTQETVMETFSSLEKFPGSQIP